MSQITLTITMDSLFAEKFIGFLNNLLSINKEKNKPFIINSAIINDGESEIVAFPRREDGSEA